MKALLDEAVGLHGQGRLAEAAPLYLHILKCEPGHSDARHMLGVLRAQQGRNAEALELIAPIVAAEPHNALALANLGNVLNALERTENALQAYDRSVALNPDYPPVHLSRGNVLQLLLRYDEALESYNRFLGFFPDHAEAWSNRGMALQNLRRLDEALEAFRRAEALDPAMPEAPLNRALCHLLMQDFASGLPLYEGRKKMRPPMEARAYPQPLWTGREDIRGKTLFAYIEQGLGDTIQFCRYALVARSMGASILLAPQKGLERLLSALDPGITIADAAASPAFDYHIPLLDMPLACHTRLSDIPASIPYLSAEAERSAWWRDRIGAHGFKIGICWQGNRAAPSDIGRSFPVRNFERIGRLDGVRLISL
ncbi:MAG TPA: tetratricopeptide repeat protein, partial [Rhizomicrobium sp.]|nr:tetratricopeptide repeat protein [Rhizomicrobium sp.]